MRHVHSAHIIGGVLTAIVLAVQGTAALAADDPSGASSAGRTGERRLALVIGNGDYANAPLRNPVNDARDLAAALADSGFEVMRLENANLRQMRTAVREFGDRLKSQGGVGLFYFAGHGMQLRGKNFLIPVGAQIEREDEIEFESLDANLVLEKLDSAGNRFNIVILDACRNNPFARAFRSTAQGLAQMDAPTGTVIAFATSPGSVASDGPGRNGLYTRYLIESVQRPGLKIEEVFKQVRTAVRRDSAGTQTPWESTSLEGDFYFHPVDRAANEIARRREEQARLEEAVRVAIAQERERIRRELEEGRVQAPSAPKAPPASAGAAVPTRPAAGPAAPGTVVGKRVEGKIAAPQFAVGDEWELFSVRAASDAASEPTSTINRITVVGVSSDRLKIAHTTLDKPGGKPLEPGKTYGVTPQLATLFDGRNAFSGQRKYLSFPLEAGATWSYTYEYASGDGRRIREQLDCNVVGWEQVSVPAGTYWALRIEEKGWSNDVSSNAPRSARGGVRLERTFWYSPDAKYLVRSEWRKSKGGTALDAPGGEPYSTHQLVRFTSAANRQRPLSEANR